MDMTLRRFRKSPHGIFSDLIDDQGRKIDVTVTHAYELGDGTWEPKVPPGRYLCVRGSHSLDGKHWFDTFEITGVEGHKGILFHQGNVEEESKGCELLGGHVGSLLEHGTEEEAVLDSAEAFKNFMSLQTGVNSFWLNVTEETANDLASDQAAS
jgi:hypothetical protein